MQIMNLVNLYNSLKDDPKTYKHTLSAVKVLIEKEYERLQVPSDIERLAYCEDMYWELGL